MEYRINSNGEIYTYEQFKTYMLSDRYDLNFINMNWNKMTPVEIQTYDSEASTLNHIKQVNSFLLESSIELLKRAQIHDSSKLEPIEKELFDRMTPILNTLKYGTEEYNDSLDELKIALKHHYENNSHHPEFYDNGINGMDLFDLIEMINDWKAATIRTSGGNILTSLKINKTRFNIDEQLFTILENTINKNNWLKHE